MTIDQTTVKGGELTISRLGLGCASLAGIFTPVPEQQARDTLTSARDAGITYFDTAPYYGHGRSERLVGDAVRERSGTTISSKVGRLLRPGASDDPGAWANPLPFTPCFDYSYDAIMRSHEDSLQRLGVDRIDLLYIHDIGSRTHGEEAGQTLFETAMTGGYRALEQLKSSGAIRGFGLGVNETAVCESALARGDWDVFMLAGRYTLLEQASLHGLLAECERRGTDMVIGGPFNSGVLAGGKHFNYGAIPEEIATRVKALHEVCSAHGVSLAAAALKFPLAHPVVKSVVPGPRSPGELAQILEWWEQDIPASLWTDLRDRNLVDAEAPIPG